MKNYFFKNKTIFYIINILFKRKYCKAKKTKFIQPTFIRSLLYTTHHALKSQRMRNLKYFHKN